MTTPHNVLLAEGLSTNRPPLFDGSNYIQWKARMKIFTQSQNYELWNVITNGLHTPTKLIESMFDKNLAELNAKAMNLLYCAFNKNIFNQICICSSAKQIWDTLEATYDISEEPHVSLLEDNCKTNIEHAGNTLNQEERFKSFLKTKKKRKLEERKKEIKRKKALTKKESSKKLKVRSNNDDISSKELQEVTNSCFMAQEDKVKSESTLTSNDFQEEFSYDELLNAFHDLYGECRKLAVKNKNLKKLNSENEILRLNSEQLIQKNQNLIKENQNLSKEINQLKSFINKFTVSSERLKMMFESQHADFDKSKFGLTPSLSNESLKKKVLNLSSKSSKRITYFKHQKNGHNNLTYSSSTIKSNGKVITIKQIWVPKGTICPNSQGPKQAWVPKMKI